MVELSQRQRFSPYENGRFNRELSLRTQKPDNAMGQNGQTFIGSIDTIPLSDDFDLGVGGEVSTFTQDNLYHFPSSTDVISLNDDFDIGAGDVTGEFAIVDDRSGLFSTYSKLPITSLSDNNSVNFQSKPPEKKGIFARVRTYLSENKDRLAGLFQAVAARTQQISQACVAHGEGQAGISSAQTSSAGDTIRSFSKSDLFNKGNTQEHSHCPKCNGEMDGGNCSNCAKAA